MRELFVYYKLSPSDEPEARALVQAAHRALTRAHPGLVARLLERPLLGSDGLRTWMETYAMSDDAGSSGIDAVTEREIEQASLPVLPFIKGERHVEAFVACA